MPEDKNIVCVDCGNEFVFTGKDQTFYASKGFGDPKRCPECRRIKKQKREAEGLDA